VERDTVARPLKRSSPPRKRWYPGPAAGWRPRAAALTAALG